MTGIDGGPLADIDGDRAVLATRNVAYSYPNGLQALEGVTVDLLRGKLLAVVGPSGCGKSTLLSVLAGLKQPSAGLVKIAASEGGRHNLSMMFQRDTLLPWLTVAENVSLFHRFRHVRRKSRQARAAELLSLVGLSDFANHHPYQLSGGMRRRIALLAAVAPYPEILLLDEPFSSLDEPTRVVIHQEMFDLIRRLEVSAILVTHDLAEAISLCDEILVMSPRPARVVARYSVPFGSKREILSLRKTGEFLSLYGTVWEELSRQIAMAAATPGVTG